jgi:ATP-dependent helicase/nuclease subunit B
MGKIYNAPFSCNFIEQFTKSVLKSTNNFQYPNNSLIVFPNKRLKSTFFQQKVFHDKQALLLPKAITFSSIDENILEFDGFCRCLSKFAVKTLEKKVITNDQLSIILHAIIEELKQKNEDVELSNYLLHQVNIRRLKKAVLEYYHYQYGNKTIFPYYKNEKVLLTVVQELDKHMEANNLSLKAISLNISVDKVIKNWNYESSKKVFAILPQTDVKYTSSFLNHLTKFKWASIFMRGMDRALYKNVSKAHYQHHIVDFLHRNQIIPESVEDIAEDNQSYDFSQFIGVENKMNSNLNNPIPNVNIVSAKDQDEEAAIVAFIIREQLEKGLKNIIVQTKSIDLATKIEFFLKFWSIEVDNVVSASYRNNPEIKLFLMVAHYLNLRDNDYCLLLDILKSKFCQFKDQKALKDFELYYLRKFLFRENISDYILDLEKSEQEKFLFLLELEEVITSAKKELKKGNKNLYEYFNIHLKVFIFLHKKHSGSNVEELLHKIEKKLEIFKYISLSKFGSYIEILDGILSANQLSANVMQNCSVRILQIFETRNMQNELLIFAGLNEGIFPNVNLDHRYFHPDTRAINQLKHFDTEVGFMEYDFINALFNKNTVLSYSESFIASGTKCRWLEKLMINKEVLERSELYTKKYKDWYQRFNNVSKQRSSDNEYFNVDVKFRPDKISVSGVEKLIINPYIYYARYIIKLKALPSICREAGKKEFGIMLHDILSKEFLKDTKELEDYASKFNNLVSAGIKKYYVPFEIARLWSVRIDNIIKNIHKYQAKNPVSDSCNELLGAVHLNLNQRKIYVSCIADRIDLSEENKLKIMDYKTGYIPNKTEINHGVYPQLSIEKFIAINGGFSDSFSRKFSDADVDLSYLDISGRLLGDIEKSITTCVAETEDGLRNLLEEFLCSKSEFFIKDMEKRNKRDTDYIHLMRIS